MESGGNTKIIGWLESDSFQLRNRYRVSPRHVAYTSRYIISADINNIYSGLGCMLMVLLPAWKYAIETGRTLIIDWRGNPYTRDDPDKNLFPLLFEAPDPEAFVVPCIADDSITQLALPQAILGPEEPIVNESGVTHQLEHGGVSIAQMIGVLARCEDVDMPTIIPALSSCFHIANRFGPYSQHPFFSVEEVTRIYRSLSPKPLWSNLIDEYQAQYFADRPVIGIHVRHGNGEQNYRDHFSNRVIKDFDTFIQVLVQCVKSLAEQRFGADYSVFVCTDSDVVVDALRPHFASFLSREIWRPQPGAGVDFDTAFKEARGVEAAGNALVDMWLLAKCDIVVRTRWTAFLIAIPYLMKKPGAQMVEFVRAS